MNASRLVAAVAASAAVHAGVALVDWSPDARGIGTVAAGEPGSNPASRAAPPMRVRVAMASPVIPPTGDATTAIDDHARLVPSLAGAGVAAPTAARVMHETRTIPSSATNPVEAQAAIGAASDEPADIASAPSAEVASPTPVSYPVLVLPPNDDPRRVGLTRLVLVVSSRGDTVDVIVTASTMSQDYVDRVVDAFRAMRFKPARMRGLPYPGTYEVVVNFEFEPPGNRAAL